MKIVLNNPYRTAGLLAGASARERERQIKRLRQYIEAEQAPPDGFGFPALGPLDRTLASVEEAAAKLNLDGDRLNTALFWFWNGNPITDEAAFDALKDGDVETAYGIWDKLITETKEDGKRIWRSVTEKNHSAFHNCFVLNMVKANGNLHNAIAGNLYFLESDLMHRFVSSVTDETYKISKKELQLSFLGQLYEDLEDEIEDEISETFMEVVLKQDFTAKQDFLNGIAKKHIEEIEREVEKSQSRRKTDKTNADKAGLDLYVVLWDLEQIENIVGKNSIKYSSIADKVANEILQCAIEHYNANYEKAYPEENYAETAIELAESAESIAVGSAVKERIRDNLNAIEKAKDKELFHAIKVLKQIKEVYFQAYSMYWDVVVASIQTAIPRQYIERIKRSSNASAVKEFKSLVDFLFGKMPSYEKRKIAYLCYWETLPEKTGVSTQTKTVSTNTAPKPTVTTPATKNNKSFPDWGWWIIGGILLLFIGLMLPDTIGGILMMILAFGCLLGIVFVMLLLIRYSIEKIGTWIDGKTGGIGCLIIAIIGFLVFQIILNITR